MTVRGFFFRIFLSFFRAAWLGLCIRLTSLTGDTRVMKDDDRNTLAG